MSARTVTEYRALAKTTKGLAHLAARRNTGTWVSRCGRQIRGQEIHEWQGEQAGVQAVALGDQFCAECRAEAIRTAGTVADGVAILLSLDPADDSAPQLLDIPLTAIAVDGPLRDPGEDLIRSVAANGVMTPVVLRRTPTGLRLVAGGRRLAASIAADHATIPAIVRDLDEQHTTVERLLENLHREGLDPIAQAEEYVNALAVLGCTKQALADGLGISRSQVSNTIRLLELPAHLREHIADRRITAEQGRDLLRVANPDEQDALADRLLAARAASRSTVARQPRDEQLVELSRLVAELLTVRKVQVRSVAVGKQITLTVPDADLARVLAQFERAA